VLCNIKLSGKLWLLFLFGYQAQRVYRTGKWTKEGMMRRARTIKQKITGNKSRERQWTDYLLFKLLTTYVHSDRGDRKLRARSEL
jgi:hypothetical protein